MWIDRSSKRSALFLWGCAWVLPTLAVSSGCSKESKTSPLVWNITLQNDALRPRMASVQVAVLRDGCQGTNVVYEQWVRKSEMPVRPPKLGSGVFAFRARAIDGTCIAFAAGCEEMELPSDAQEVSVVMLTQTEQVLCSPSECSFGVCVNAFDGGVLSDGGMSGDSGGSQDAGTDSGPHTDSGVNIDSGLDSGADSGTDSGPDAGPDACAILTEACDGINNDCDSDIDEGCCDPSFTLARKITATSSFRCYSAKQSPMTEAQAISTCTGMAAIVDAPPLGECGAFHDGNGQQCFSSASFSCGVGTGLCRPDGGVQGANGCSTCYPGGTSSCSLSCTQPFFCTKAPLH